MRRLVAAAATAVACASAAAPCGWAQLPTTPAPQWTFVAVTLDGSVQARASAEWLGAVARNILGLDSGHVLVADASDGAAVQQLLHPFGPVSARVRHGDWLVVVLLGREGSARSAPGSRSAFSAVEALVAPQGGGEDALHRGPAVVFAARELSGAGARLDGGGAWYYDLVGPAAGAAPGPAPLLTDRWKPPAGTDDQNAGAAILPLGLNHRMLR